MSITCYLKQLKSGELRYLKGWNLTYGTNALKSMRKRIFKIKSEKASKSRSNQVIISIAGSKSFCQKEYEMMDTETGEMADPYDVWAVEHRTKKNALRYYDLKLKKVYKKLKEFGSQPTQEGEKPLHKDEIYARILGTRSDLSHGRGADYKSTKTETSKTIRISREWKFMKKKCMDMQAKLHKMKVVEGRLTEMTNLKERLQHIEEMMAHFLLHERVNSPSNESNKVDNDEIQAPSDYEARQKVQKFLDAARTGNLDLFKKLAMQLDEGKGLAKTVAAVKDANKRTALHFAAREGRTEVCKYLLEELKLDVNMRDDDGETPLIHASRQGHFLTAKYLLDQGTDPSASSELGATALHHAAGIGNIELLRLLLSKGVDVESQSDAGTPLIWAAGHGQQHAVKVLLEHHSNPNAETDDNITPLLSAVAAGSLPCLELLIQAGASPNISAGGATPLHVAADNGSREVIDCLLKAGGDPNICDDDGLKPIQVAALRGNRGAVKILFPLTSLVPDISNWSIDGIIEYMQSEAKKEQENMKEANLPKGANVQKPETVEVTPEAKKKSLEAKARGEDAFKRKDYQMAVDAYTQAIDLDPNEATLLSNRSLCWMRLGQGECALADAKACRARRPDWPKACYREGAALRLLQRFDEAANAFYEGVKLDPENKELVNAFREAVEAGRKFHGTDQQEQ
ncbi:putative ankyrin-1 [Cocos nucifera]|uniref:Putative ankyrin-1 n=1 Tax=Cocos nucifera TaxID=13894 RepID=A0A8K0I247_COCNU|nr:putative ankyrin-1 [Cocos nucifera]